MKKLSLLRVLKEAETDLEDFSSQMEEDETPQQKQQRAANAQQTPQQTWGTQGVADNDLTDFRKEKTIQQIGAEHNLPPGTLESFVQNVQAQGFTDASYQQLSKMVGGDVDNFMMEIQDHLPQVYNAFVDGGLDKVAANAANQLRAAPGKQMSKVATPNNPNDATWQQLAAQNPNQVQQPVTPTATTQTQSRMSLMPQQAQEPATNPGIMNRRKRGNNG